MNYLKDNSNLKKIFDNKGWVIVKKVFSKKDVAEINKKVDSFLKNEIKKYKGKNINFTDNQSGAKIENINSFHKLSDSAYIKKKSRNKKITKIVKNILEAKPKYIASELFAKPAGKGLKSPLHQDNYYWCIKNGNALTVWVALDDVSSKNGGLTYYDSTHKLGTVKHKPSYAKGSSQTVANIKKYAKYKKTCPKLSPGDALFHHCEIIHGSSENKSGLRRRGLTFQYKDQLAKYDIKMKNRYLKSLKEQINLREKNKRI